MTSYINGIAIKNTDLVNVRFGSIADVRQASYEIQV